MRRLTELLLLAFLSTATVARAQDTAWVRVSANTDDAYVYVDSVRFGSADAAVFSVSPGEHVIRLVAPEITSWSIAPVQKAITAVAGDTLDVALAFPHYYRIESLPYGAEILVEGPEGRARVGVTPFTLTTPEPLSRKLFVEKPGYHSVEIDPGGALWNRHAVVLDRTVRDLEPVSSAEVPWTPPRSLRSNWIDYGALGLAVASAILSVHYKFQADDLYQEYEETGDPTLRSRIESLDTRSAVALGAMQVGVGVFAIRLVLR